MPLVRFIIPFVLAGFVTFGLFYLMQSLIGVEGQLDDSDKIKVVDFVRVKRSEEVKKKETEKNNNNKKKKNKEKQTNTKNYEEN